jgi:hypothetical protein
MGAIGFQPVTPRAPPDDLVAISAQGILVHPVGGGLEDDHAFCSGRAHPSQLGAPVAHPLEEAFPHVLRVGVARIDLDRVPVSLEVQVERSQVGAVSDPQDAHVR